MEPSLKWAGNPNVTVAVRAFGLKATVQVTELVLCFMKIDWMLKSSVTNKKNLSPVHLTILISKCNNLRCLLGSVHSLKSVDNISMLVLVFDH